MPNTTTLDQATQLATLLNNKNADEAKKLIFNHELTHLDFSTTEADDKLNNVGGDTLAAVIRCSTVTGLRVVNVARNHISDPESQGRFRLACSEKRVVTFGADMQMGRPATQSRRIDPLVDSQWTPPADASGGEGLAVEGEWIEEEDPFSQLFEGGRGASDLHATTLGENGHVRQVYGASQQGEGVPTPSAVRGVNGSGGNNQDTSFSEAELAEAQQGVEGAVTPPLHPGGRGHVNSLNAERHRSSSPNGSTRGSVA